ncbi:MAG: prolyl-tRNA synthetase associated domain-containing protein [Rhodospirillales bacterium]
MATSRPGGESGSQTWIKAYAGRLCRSAHQPRAEPLDPSRPIPHTGAIALLNSRIAVAATPADLFAYLDQLGIEHSTIEHPPIFTVEEGRAWHDKIPGLHCKNLFIKDRKGGIWLVVMPGEKRADLNRLEKLLAAPRFSFGRPELLAEVLELTPGSVTPFGLINDRDHRVTVVLDQEMLESEWVNYHPLHNAASTTLRSADLVRFVKALGYEPIIIRLPEVEAR